jgi:hypothetical protein
MKLQNSIYTKWVGGADTTGITPRLADPIKKYGTVICREPDYYESEEHEASRWKPLSKVELLIEIGRGIPIYTWNGTSYWHRVKI